MDKRKGRKIARERMTTNSVVVDTELTFDELFDVFIAAKEAEGRAERTIKEHRKNYQYFREWLDVAYPKILPKDVEISVIREWISYMLNDKVAYESHPFKPREFVGLAPGTVNIRLRSIKCMFKFWYDEQYLTFDPTARVKILRVEDDGIQAFTAEQLRLLLLQPDKSTYAGYRDYVLMLTLIDTGMRINELLNLTPSDVDFRTLTITIPAKISKTRKARQIPISKKTAKELATLINEVKAAFNHNDWIFVSNYGEKFYDNYFRLRLKEYGERAGIRGVRVSPHTFRHTFAKMFILNGGDPFTLQRILGHADITMCKRYINMFLADVKAVHRRSTPLETIKL